MNRRNFLGLMVGGVAAAAAVRTFPFRVFSFPNEPKLWIGTDYGFSGCSSMRLSSLINLTLERVSDQINENLIPSDTLISQFKSGRAERVSNRLFRIVQQIALAGGDSRSMSLAVRGWDR